MNIMNALKGPGGEYEVNRIVGAAGVLTYVATAPAFVAWSIAQGHPFDLVAFCTAYPSGLGIAIGAMAGSIAVKDRNVATARVIAGGAPAPTPPLTPTTGA